MSQTIDYTVEVVGEPPPPKVPWKIVASVAASAACIGAIAWGASR